MVSDDEKNEQQSYHCHEIITVLGIESLLVALLVNLGNLKRF